MSVTLENLELRGLRILTRLRLSPNAGRLCRSLSKRAAPLTRLGAKAQQLHRNITTIIKESSNGTE